MPFPDLSDVQDGMLAGEALVFGNMAQSQAELAAAGHGDPLAQAAPALSGPYGWPEGLETTVTAPAIEGMPSHLARPGTDFVPSPNDLDPDQRAAGANNLADPATAPTVQVTTEQLLEMQLSATLPAPTSATAVPSPAAPPPTPASAASGPAAAPGAGTAAILYQDLGPALRLGVEDDDGLVWKVVCKTGTLALSPGPGATDVEKPLQLTDELFDDMLLSYQEQAMPYVTVPETHANGPLENTGYVKAAEKLTKEQALADDRVNASAREAIEDDPDDTRYLLAGIDFKLPDVKEKAKLGAIPDTSIGVKFGYRNKRTGKEYKAAWEHVALTPIPWVDGLGAFGLSQPGIFDQEQVPDHVDVYTDLDLAGVPDFIKNKGDGDDKAAQGKKKKCSNCGTLNKADATKCTKCGHALVGHKARDRTKLSVDEKAMGLMLGMNISIHGDRWDDPNIDTGKLGLALNALGNGDRLNLPLGVGVQKIDSDGESFWLVTEGYEDNPKLVRDEEKLSAAVQECMQRAHAREEANRRKYAQPTVAEYGAEPDVDLTLAEKSHKLKCPKCDTVQSASNKTCTNCGHDLTDARKAKFANLAVSAERRKRAPTIPGTNSFPIENEQDLKNAIQAYGRAKNKDKAKAHIIARAKALGKTSLLPDGWNLSAQRLAELRLSGERLPESDVDDEALERALEDSDGDPLPEGTEPGTIHASASTDEGNYTMTMTVEELLAQQQAELERERAERQRLESELASSRTNLSALDHTVRANEIREKVTKLQKDGLPAGVLLAAQAVYIQDDTPRGTEGDLALSVQVPHTKDDGTVENTETKLTTPTEIVDFILSAMPRVDTSEAARMAALQEGIPALALTAHEPEDEVAEKQKVAAEAAAKRHPELYNPDGTLKDPAKAA